MEADAVFADLSQRTLDLLQIPGERRHARRLRLTVPLPARLGRADVVVVDLGRRGARLRHDRAIEPGSRTTLTFDWPGGPFRAVVRVLSSRLLASNAPKFESRLQFLEVPPGSAKVLQRVVATLTDEQLRNWVSNFMGQEAASREDHQPERRLLSFRFSNRQWITRPAAAHEPPPPDGFIVPASMEPGEIRTLCAVYQRLDRDGQQLLRLFASAVLAA